MHRQINAKASIGAFTVGEHVLSSDRIALKFVLSVVCNLGELGQENGADICIEEVGDVGNLLVLDQSLLIVQIIIFIIAKVTARVGVDHGPAGFSGYGRGRVRICWSLEDNRLDNTALKIRNILLLAIAV